MKKAYETTVSSGEVGRTAPLTFQQEWLWGLLQRYTNWSCILPFALRLHGALNIDCLRRSLEEILRRHGALRTRIVTVDGVPMQQVGEPGEYRLEVTSFADESRAEADRKVHLAVDTFFTTRIDLSVGPMFDAKLLKCADQNYVLIISIHHIITDGFSCNIMFRELWILYAGFLKGKSVSLAPLVEQYADCAVWQRETHPAWLEAHEAYWKKRLSGASRIRWPVDRDVRGVSASRFELVQIRFGEALSAGVRQLALSSRKPIAMIMLTVYVATVWKWCKQADFIVPFNIAGRNRREHEQVIGYFAHVLFLRMEMTGRETFADLLNQVTREFFRAGLHQDQGRMVAQAPGMLQGTFFQWLPWQPDELAGVPTSALLSQLDGSITVEPFPLTANTAGLPDVIDISLMLYDSKEGICATGNCRADLFTANTTQRFAQDLRESLEQFLRNPDGCVTSEFNARAASQQ